MDQLPNMEERIAAEAHYGPDRDLEMEELIQGLEHWKALYYERHRDYLELGGKNLDPVIEGRTCDRCKQAAPLSRMVTVYRTGQVPRVRCQACYQVAIEAGDWFLEGGDL